MEWRKEILAGINILPVIGTPGRIVVLRKPAESILTGTNAEDILVAAAELGKGRIVAISHDGYGDNFIADYRKSGSSNETMKIFCANLKSWLTRGAIKCGGEGIIVAEECGSEAQLGSSKLVVWHGGHAGHGSIDPCCLREFVRNGGALLHCCTPWGWLQLNAGKCLYDIPYTSTLTEAGLGYTGAYISSSESGFDVKENKAVD